MASVGTADTLLGAMLEGRFRVERLLGEGGMGRVYEAEELRLRRRCALKVLLPDMMADPVCVERFLREAQAIAQLHHQNIVAIHHLGDDQAHGVVFFAMELLDGEDLEARLCDRARRPISWSEICSWGRQIAGAMATVHAAGLIHRDLKPANVFLARRRDGREQVKLLDFGIARPMEQSAALTATNAGIGTPYYMSPEQVLRAPVDHRSDIYSLGVLLFEALAGRPPFLGEPMQVAMQHCNLAPPPLASLAPDVPDRLGTLVMEMLAKAPIARPQSMDEVESALLRLLPTEAESTGRMSPLDLAATSSMAPTLVFDGSRVRRSLPDLAPVPKRPMRAAVTLATLAAIVLVVTLGGGNEAPSSASTAMIVNPPVPSEPAGPTRPPPAEPPPPAKPPEPTPPPFDEAPSEPAKPTKKTSAKADTAPVDPVKSLARVASACRRQHNAANGPKIVVDYATRGDGTVTRAIPAIRDALGECLAGAVRRARFPPEFKLGQKIEL